MRNFGIIIAAIVLLQTSGQPAQAGSGDSANNADGFRLIYHQRAVGMVQMDISPIGAKVMTSFMNACIRGTDSKKEEVIIFNPDSKTYNTFTIDDFKKKARRIYTRVPDPHWERVLKSVTPAEKIQGHPTKLYVYLLRNVQHPEVAYTDRIWTDADMKTPPRAKEFLSLMLSCPEGVPGVPLRFVKTMHLNPVVTETSIELQSIQKRRFKSADFGPPANYKLSTNDSELVDFGTLPLSH